MSDTLNTSNSIGYVSFTTDQLLGHAVRRCGVSTGALPAEVSEALVRIAFMWLSNLANRGVELWTVAHTVVGLIPGQIRYPLPRGTVAVQRVLYRTSVLTPIPGPSGSAATGTATSQIPSTLDALVFDRDLRTSNTYADNGTLTGPWVGYKFPAVTMPTSVGWISSVHQYLRPQIDRSADGITWTPHYTIPGDPRPNNTLGYVECQAGQWVWFEIPQATQPGYVYWRLRNVGAQVMGLTELQFSSRPNEVQAGRFNRDDYQQMNNKRTQGGRSVLNFWFDRKNTNPELVVWPMPSYGFDQLSVYRYRHIQDPGTLTQELELPQRWWNAAVKNIALEIFQELPSTLVDAKRWPMMEKAAAQALMDAEGGENEDSPMRLAPMIGGYTR